MNICKGIKCLPVKEKLDMIFETIVDENQVSFNIGEEQNMLNNDKVSSRLKYFDCQGKITDIACIDGVNVINISLAYAQSLWLLCYVAICTYYSNLQKREEQTDAQRCCVFEKSYCLFLFAEIVLQRTLSDEEIIVFEEYLKRSDAIIDRIFEGAIRFVIEH